MTVIEPEAPELTEEQLRTAITDQNQLLRWVESRRPWIVMNGVHLVRALPFPSGHQLLQQLIECYSHMRRSIPIPYIEVGLVKNPETGEVVEEPTVYQETLSVQEIDRCVSWLLNVVKPAALEREARASKAAQESRR